MLTLHTDTPERFDRARQALDGGVAIGDATAERGRRWSSTGSAEIGASSAPADKCQADCQPGRSSLRSWLRPKTAEQPWRGHASGGSGLPVTPHRDLRAARIAIGVALVAVIVDDFAQPGGGARSTGWGIGIDPAAVPPLAWTS